MGIALIIVGLIAVASLIGNIIQNQHASDIDRRRRIAELQLGQAELEVEHLLAEVAAARKAEKADRKPALSTKEVGQVQIKDTRTGDTLATLEDVKITYEESSSPEHFRAEDLIRSKTFDSEKGFIETPEWGTVDVNDNGNGSSGGGTYSE